MTTVGDDMPKQQARVREILQTYRDIGPAGAFGAMMIEQALQAADRAVIGGDIVEILAAYQSLKDVHG